MLNYCMFDPVLVRLQSQVNSVLLKSVPQILHQNHRIILYSEYIGVSIRCRDAPIDWPGNQSHQVSDNICDERLVSVRSVRLCASHIYTHAAHLSIRPPVRTEYFMLFIKYMCTPFNISSVLVS